MWNDVAPAGYSTRPGLARRAPHEPAAVAAAQNVLGRAFGIWVGLTKKITVAGALGVMRYRENDERRIVVDVQPVVVGLAVEHVVPLNDHPVVLLTVKKAAQRIAREVRRDVIRAERIQRRIAAHRFGRLRRRVGEGASARRA